MSSDEVVATLVDVPETQCVIIDDSCWDELPTVEALIDRGDGIEQAYVVCEDIDHDAEFGEYSHRISILTEDELAELAEAQ